VSYRDDGDALLARNEALERELEEAQRELAAAKEALDAERNPPAAVEEQAPVGAPSPPAPAHRPPAGTRAEGERLAAELSSADQDLAARARQDLRGAPPVVTDAAAAVLAKLLRRGGADAERVCQALEARDSPRFGGRSYQKIFRSLTKASSASGSLGAAAQRAQQAFLAGGIDDDYLRKKEAARAARPASLLRRILSIFTRAWVIVVLGLPGLFGILALITEPGARPYVGAALAGATILVVAMDAYLRRCRSCRRLLAGTLLSIVKDNYGDHIRSWSCAHCGHRWQT
jgi:hypothetical protein